MANRLHETDQFSFIRRKLGVTRGDGLAKEGDRAAALM